MLKYQKGQYLNPHIDGHTPGTIRVGEGRVKSKVPEGRQHELVAREWDHGPGCCHRSN